MDDRLSAWQKEKGITGDITGIIVLTLANRNDPISVMPPKVGKASTIVTVTCRCRWHCCLKNIANVHEP